MKIGRTLLRVLLFSTENLNSPILRTNPSTCSVNNRFRPLSTSPSYSKLRFFTSRSESSNQNTNPRSNQSQNFDDQSSIEDVSAEELRKRMETFEEVGDDKAFVSLFEAILKRRLSRVVGDASDNEWTAEFGDNTTDNRPLSDSEFDSSEDER